VCPRVAGPGVVVKRRNSYIAMLGIEHWSSIHYLYKNRKIKLYKTLRGEHMLRVRTKC
jgi:hypothetical protein